MLQFWHKRLGNEIMGARGQYFTIPTDSEDKKWIWSLPVKFECPRYPITFYRLTKIHSQVPATLQRFWSEKAKATIEVKLYEPPITACKYRLLFSLYFLRFYLWILRIVCVNPAHRRPRIYPCTDHRSPPTQNTHWTQAPSPTHTGRSEGQYWL